jgi:hypothetical protein
MSTEDTRVSSDQLALPRPYVGPRYAIEEVLSEIWCAVYMGCVGVEDD